MVRFNMQRLIKQMRSLAAEAHTDQVVLVASDGKDEMRVLTVTDADRVLQEFPGLVVGTYAVATPMQKLSAMIREDMGAF
jgi:hypothetical protein